MALAVCALLAAAGVARRPTRGAAVALAALALLIGWVALSGSWSHAPWRGTLDITRDLAYLATLAAFALLGRTDGRARTLLLALAAAALVVAVAGLGAWLAPDHVHGIPAADRERLSAPTTYWNASGMLAALGAVWCVAISATDRSRVLRVVAAAAIAPAAAVVYLSASRGAALAALVGLAVLVAAGPARRTLTALAAAGPAAGLALLAAHGAHGLDVQAPTGAALHSGHRAALLILGAAVLGAASRAALLALDDRLAAWSPGGPPRLARGAALAGLVVLGVAIGTAVALQDTGNAVSSSLAPNQRFQEIGTNGRADLWHVALADGTRPAPLKGAGAGSFGRLWDRDGTTHFEAADAHSLYAETLGELGLVGFALLAVLLATLVVALLCRAAASRDATWAGLAAGALALLAHAAYDFDWELVALTLPLLAAGGLALARAEDDGEPRAAPLALPLRAAVVAATVALAVVPFAVQRSQRAVDRSLDAFAAGDCAAAQRHATAARSGLVDRPEPYEVASWCATQAGDTNAALTAAQQAVDRDPGDFRLRLAQAIVQARLGRDPRAAFAAALERSPASLDLKHARPVLGRAHQPVWWKRGAAAIPFPQPRLAGRQLPADTG
ncbi:O-antigen ligase family protein [Conexibacter woesei]|uniref:O-antigen ligase family protein n=1 Tax=Conexibacter woesei TaxID=191495 RepID=UPI00041242AD|nr:O-antigen ligase family protein [Conexibacter woesei]